MNNLSRFIEKMNKIVVDLYKYQKTGFYIFAPYEGNFEVALNNLVGSLTVHDNYLLFDGMDVQSVQWDHELSRRGVECFYLVIDFFDPHDSCFSYIEYYIYPDSIHIFYPRDSYILLVFSDYLIPYL